MVERAAKKRTRAFRKRRYGDSTNSPHAFERSHCVSCCFRHSPITPYISGHLGRAWCLARPWRKPTA